MNAPIKGPPPSSLDRPNELKLCRCCHAHKPMTSEHFQLKWYVNGHKTFRSMCRTCKNKHDRERYYDTGERPRAKTPEPRAEVIPEHKPGSICPRCHSMPWRVVGPACVVCLSAYADEPPLELEAFMRRDPGYRGL